MLEPQRRRVPQLRARRRQAAARDSGWSTGPTCSRSTAPEMTVLVGGMRALGANFGGSSHGVLHRPAGHADQRLLRQPARRAARSGRPSSAAENVYEGRDAATGDVRWTATAVDLVFGVELPAAGHRRGLRRRRRQGEVRARLRGRVGQGHEPRPLRPRLTPPSVGGDDDLAEGAALADAGEGLRHVGEWERAVDVDRDLAGGAEVGERREVGGPYFTTSTPSDRPVTTRQPSRR